MKIPCEDCIVFPMCKSKYVTTYASEHVLSLYIFDSCTLLSSLAENVNGTHDRFFVDSELCKLFGVKEFCWGNS